MLTRIDRLLVAADEAATSARRWTRLLDAGVVDHGREPSLGARRTVLRCGTTDVEILEADGAGPVQDRIRSGGPGIFGVGVATADLDAVATLLQRGGAAFERHGGRLHVDPAATGGLPVVVSADRGAEPVGLLDHVFEVTHLVRDGAATCERFMALFGIAPENRCHFDGTAAGYRTFLPTFDPSRRLDRVEIGEPLPGGAMDRFLARRGPSPYMCHVEAADVAAIATRLRELQLRFTDDPPAPPEALLYVHPSSLGGVLMGVCRRGHFRIARRDGRWVWTAASRDRQSSES